MTKKLKIGDVFQVQINPSEVRHFQYIANDLTQLNSQVVRVFRDSYDTNESFDADRILSGVIDFYAHVFLRIGLKQKFWRKVGHAPAPNEEQVLFRDSSDYGDPEIKISHNWYIWKPNLPFEIVGELAPRYRSAEIGVVVPPDSLVHRMRTGSYDFVYPNYAGSSGS